MNIPILYEDDALLVIDKPPHLVVNRAQSVKDFTVQDWVEAYLSFPRPPASAMLKALRAGTRESSVKDGSPIESGMTVNDDDFYNRSGVVHRIDKETSGILLIAKTPEAFVELQRQFKAHEIKKTYLAIVHGKLVPEEGEINAPIDRLPWNPQRFGVMPGGKESVTRYKRVMCHVSRVTNEEVSLVEVYPQTGRTHQIRVHLKYINHPIVGDYLYAGRKTSRDDRAGEAPRVMLHAWKISFVHPTKGTSLAIESPIPDDMNSIINSKSQASSNKQTNTSTNI